MENKKKSGKEKRMARELKNAAIHKDILNKIADSFTSNNELDLSEFGDSVKTHRFTIERYSNKVLQGTNFLYVDIRDIDNEVKDINKEVKVFEKMFGLVPHIIVENSVSKSSYDDTRIKRFRIIFALDTEIDSEYIEKFYNLVKMLVNKQKITSLLHKPSLCHNSLNLEQSLTEGFNQYTYNSYQELNDSETLKDAIDVYMKEYSYIIKEAIQFSAKHQYSDFEDIDFMFDFSNFNLNYYLEQIYAAENVKLDWKSRLNKVYNSLFILFAEKQIDNVELTDIVNNYTNKVHAYKKSIGEKLGNTAEQILDRQLSYAKNNPSRIKTSEALKLLSKCSTSYDTEFSNVYNIVESPQVWKKIDYVTSKEVVEILDFAFEKTNSKQLLCASAGSGKTTSMLNTIATDETYKNKRIVFAVPLTSQLKAITSQYDKIPAKAISYGFKDSDTFNAGFCKLESGARIIVTTFDKVTTYSDKADLVIIDEVHELLPFSDISDDKKKRLFSIDNIETSKVYITATPLNLYDDFDKKYFLYKEYTKDIEILTCKDNVVNHIDETLVKGKRHMIYVNNKNNIDDLVEEYNAKGYNCYAFNSSKKDKKEFVNLIDNNNKTNKFDIIFTTKAANVGVDIQNKIDILVYADDFNNKVCMNSLIQFSNRDRQAKEFKIIMRDSNNNTVFNINKQTSLEFDLSEYDKNFIAQFSSERSIIENELISNRNAFTNSLYRNTSMSSSMIESFFKDYLDAENITIKNAKKQDPKQFRKSMSREINKLASKDEMYKVLDLLFFTDEGLDSKYIVDLTEEQEYIQRTLHIMNPVHISDDLGNVEFKFASQEDEDRMRELFNDIKSNFYVSSHLKNAPEDYAYYFKNLLSDLESSKIIVNSDSEEYIIKFLNENKQYVFDSTEDTEVHSKNLKSVLANIGLYTSTKRITKDGKKQSVRTLLVNIVE